MARKPTEPISRERVERAARMYRNNAEAATALGLAWPTSFARLCHRYGVLTPYERRHGKRRAWAYGKPPVTGGRRRGLVAAEAAKVRALFEADREARRKRK